ncbi:DinB family protein [Lacibacter sp. H375]|uniref:DinB family protein n=1 Tax=Lacibacter sp. H375 TaxID=3133424 RepID=UPI0030BB6B9E
MHMITGTVQIASLINHIEQVTGTLVQLLQAIEEPFFNQRPGADKWSIAQVADHIRLSNNSVAKALALKGNPVDRNPGERIDELKKIFLDFQKKYQSPDFIVPTKNIYDPELLLKELQESIQRIRERMYEDDLDEMIHHPAFGNISKFEILHFVLYHTQRHLRQIKEIAANL